jgi:hypothetical protein
VKKLNTISTVNNAPKKRGRPASVNKPAPKKRGRPAGVKNKPVLSDSTPLKSDWVNTTKLNDAVIDQQRTRIDVLIRQIDSLREEIVAKDEEILKYKIDILDQSAVINYLEKKLEKPRG